MPTLAERQRMREVARIRTELEQTDWEMRELKMEVRKYQRWYAARLEMFNRRAKAIVDRQQALVDRVAALEGGADDADHD